MKYFQFVFFQFVFFLFVCSGTGSVNASVVPAFPAHSVVLMTETPQDTTIAPIKEPGQRISKVAIGFAGAALGAAALYGMFISGGGVLIPLAVIACLVGLIAGLISLGQTKKKTQSRKRGVAAILLSLIMLGIGIWQGGKALDQG
jgi:hypothetical protein